MLVDQFYRVNAIPFCAEVNNQGFTKFGNNLASIPDLHVYTNQNKSLLSQLTGIKTQKISVSL